MKFLPRLELSLLGLILAWLLLGGFSGLHAPFFKTPTGASAESPPAGLSAWLPGGIEITDPARVAQLIGSGRGTGMKAVVAESTGMDVLFPHMGDGQDIAGDIRIVTSIIVIGTGTRDSDVELLFFKENGTPLEVSIGGITASQFPFSVKVGETRRIQTDGTGPIKVGWAKLHVSQPVGASLTFAITRINGQLDSEVGVDQARPQTELAIFAEFSAASNTAMAFLNTDSTVSNRVDLFLHDLDGNLVATASETLEPGGKRAQFLTERFPALAGAGSFQGLLILKGEKPLAVLTLRSRGRHLTSLPSVSRQLAGYPAQELFFYRVGSGVLENIRIQTSFILINHSDFAVNGTLDLFQDDGMPLVVRFGNQEGSTFNFSLNANGAAIVTTSDTGPVQTGWARFKPDKALEATATFTLLEAGAGASGEAGVLAAGDFISEVGVNSTIPYERTQIFADSIGDRDTAIALSNPADFEANYGFNLFDKNGNFVRSLFGQKLPPRGHTARFITEIFKDLVPNINEFEGRIEVFCTTIEPGCVVGTLRLAGSFLTSLPVLLELHGFKPTTTVELHSELGGSMPSGAFKIQQFDDDMVLQRVEISLPEVGFDNSLFENATGPVVFGDTGQGNAVLTLGYLESIAADGTVELDLQQFNLNPNNLREAILQSIGRMTLSGASDSGFQAVVEFGARPRSFNGDDFFFQVFVPPTILKLPAGGTTLHSETRLFSVSTSYYAVSRLQEVNRQDIVLPDFAAPLAAGAPQILFLNPIQGRSQAPLVLQGMNLSDNTAEIQAFFTGLDGNPVASEIVARDGNFLLLDIPDGVKSGPVTIRQDNQDSNPYLFRVVFDPQDQFTIGSLVNNTAVNIGASLSQQNGEFAFLNWKIELDRGSVNLTGWAPEQLVGTGKWTKDGFATDYILKIDSVFEDSLTLNMVQASFPSSSPDLRLKLSNLSGGGVVIENVVSSEPLVPRFTTQEFKIEWETTTPLFQLPAGAGQTLTANGTNTSVLFGLHPDVKYVTYSERTFITQ